MEINLAVKPLNRRVCAAGLILCTVAFSGCSLLGNPGPMPVLTKSEQIQKVEANEQLVQNNQKLPPELKAQQLAFYQKQLSDIQGSNGGGDPSKK